jgi:hypothetical protein
MSAVMSSCRGSCVLNRLQVSIVLLARPSIFKNPADPRKVLSSVYPVQIARSISHFTPFYSSRQSIHIIGSEKFQARDLPSLSTYPRRLCSVLRLPSLTRLLHLLVHHRGFSAYNRCLFRYPSFCSTSKSKAYSGMPGRVARKYRKIPRRSCHVSLRA